jgi:hypothetical protein
MAGNFDRLVGEGIIINPDAFTAADKAQINTLSQPEVDALISIRHKLGDNFIQSKTTGPAPSMAIVF